MRWTATAEPRNSWRRRRRLPIQRLNFLINDLCIGLANEVFTNRLSLHSSASSSIFTVYSPGMQNSSINGAWSSLVFIYVYMWEFYVRQVEFDRTPTPTLLCHCLGLRTDLNPHNCVACISKRCEWLQEELPNVNDMLLVWKLCVCVEFGYSSQKFSKAHIHAVRITCNYSVNLNTTLPKSSPSTKDCNHMIARHRSRKITHILTVRLCTEPTQITC